MNIVTENSSILKVVLIGAGVSIIIFAMKLSAPILSSFLLAGVIGISVLPATSWLIRKGVTTWLALLITIVLIFLGVVGLIAVIGVSVKSLIDTLPQYQENLEELLVSFRAGLGGIGLKQRDLETAITGIETGNVIGSVVSFLGGILSNLSNLLVMLMVLIFFILGAPMLTTKIRKNYPSDSPIISRFRNLFRDLQRYVIITTWINFLVGLVNTIFLIIIGVDFAVLWGVLSFLTGYIPNIGFWIALIPPFLLALLQFGVGKALIVLVGFIVINGGVQNFLQPRMMGAGLNLSVLVVTVSLFFWAWVLGPMGAILAIPLTMIVKEVFLDAYDDTRGLSELMSSADPPSKKSDPEVPAS
jgi:predicted PurR-regulated permease PerM